MHKTVVIPTDFTVTPLLVLKHYVLSNQEPVDVVFLYSVSLGDSILDLLFSSPRHTVATSLLDEFKEGAEIMQNRYPARIRRISYHMFHGNTGNAFRSLAEVNHYDKVLVAPDHRLSRQHGLFDPLPMIKRSGIELQEVPVRTYSFSLEKDLLATLLTA